MLLERFPTDKNWFLKIWENFVEIARTRGSRVLKGQVLSLSLRINHVISIHSNFFVFQSYELRFSVFLNQFLIRSFPGSFCVNFISRRIPTTTCGWLQKCSWQLSTTKLNSVVAGGWVILTLQLRILSSHILGVAPHNSSSLLV